MDISQQYEQLFPRDSMSSKYHNTYTQGISERWIYSDNALLLISKAARIMLHTCKGQIGFRTINAVVLQQSPAPHTSGVVVHRRRKGDRTVEQNVARNSFHYHVSAVRVRLQDGSVDDPFDVSGLCRTGECRYSPLSCDLRHRALQKSCVHAERILPAAER